MKCIDAIINPSKVEDVKGRVRQVGVKSMIQSKVTDCCGTDGRLRIYRGSSFFINDATKARIQIIVDEDMVGPVVDTIMATASPGEVDAGSISIYPVAETVRIQVDARPNGTIGDRHYDHATVA